VIAIALFLLPWVPALVLVRRHHHLDGGTVGILVSVSLGLPTLWLMWTSYRGPKRSGAAVSSLSLAQVADNLAVAVRKQWADEVAIRRLNDPYPLPVSWIAADASLTDPWDSLLKLATRGVGWPKPPPWGTWAVGPDDLAGAGNKLAEMLTRVPTGRLVVLGEPGAGKTMLMVRLVLDLLARREGGDPVPILVSAASWNPLREDLREWLGVQLVTDHPALAARLPVGVTEPTLAKALLASGMILPVLDGLDEIPDAIRGSAMSRINDALRPGEQAVITCRTRQYLNAVHPEDGAAVTLRATAVVQLQPLEADAVRSYMSDDAAGAGAKARWRPVLEVLGTDTPAGQALSTPLMVGLARAVYNRRPGELTGTLRDPAELCSPDLSDQAAVESLLFDEFIPAAYRHDPAIRWRAKNAERWLVFLAGHLEYTICRPNLAWWQLSLAVPNLALTLAAVLSIAFGAVIGAVFEAASKAEPMTRTLSGIVVGAVGALVLGVVIYEEVKKTSGIRVLKIHMQRPTRNSIRSGLEFGAGIGVLIGFVSGFAFGTMAAAAVGVAAGIMSGTVVAAVDFEETGQRNASPNVSSAASPLALLAADRRAVIALGAGFGIVPGAMLGAAAGALAGALAGAVMGAACGAAFLIVVSFGLAAWPAYDIARMWLALRHRLPWRLMEFLADAHRRGVLRQTGAVYQFRHIELQHRLANRGYDNAKAS
jgi:hypothetical protein